MFSGYVPGSASSKVLKNILLEDFGYFFVTKSLTILPKIVTPKIMPVTIARKTARIRVNLKTRKKSGINIMQSIIVRQPVAKSFVSNIG
jgi:hypothetical protein